MPVLRFKPGRVEEALRLPLREALEVVERLKIEAEITSDGFVEMEVEVDRPDMYSLEGIARQADGLLGRAEGMPRYRVQDSGYVLEAGDVPARPYIAAGVVWGVNVDEEYLEELIQFQEKLHTSLGGRRELVAIGLHDLDKLPSRRLSYRLEPIDKVRFKPLGHEHPMTLKEVLRETAQGRSYGALSLQGRMHPVLYSGDEVISVPPVINSELTRIEPGTSNVFVDVTGTNRRLVLDTLSVIVANLAERSRDRKVGMVTVISNQGVFKEPKLEPRSASLSASYTSSVLGTRLEPGEVSRHLRRMRFDAREEGEDIVIVGIPRYRIDILHPVDLVEEVMLSIGVEELGVTPPARMMRGRLLGQRYWEREARKLLAGMGFVEIISYSLVSCKRLEHLLGVDEKELVRLANPVGAESSCMRYSIIPQLLDVARVNQHNIPVRVFEAGEAYSVRGQKPVARKKLAILLMDEKAGYEDIQAVVYSLARLLGDEVVEVREASHPLFIEGRAAVVKTRHGLEALLGEIRPEILAAENIDYPVAAAEIDYSEVAVPRH